MWETTCGPKRRHTREDRAENKSKLYFSKLKSTKTRRLEKHKMSLEDKKHTKKPSKATSTVAKWDGLTFGAFPGCVTRCSRPYVMISATQAHKSDDLHLAMSPFTFFLSFFLSSFLGTQRIIVYGRMRWIIEVHPPKSVKSRLCGVHLEEPSNWDSLHAALWHNWTSKCGLRRMQPLN